MSGHANKNASPHPLAEYREGPADPHKGTAILAATIFVLTMPVLIFVALRTFPMPVAERWGVEAASLGLEPMDLARGASTYSASCAVCHGARAEGVANLGKPLRNSAFVRGLSDAELHDQIVRGRAPSDPLNTTGALMPPRGAMGLDDARIDEVVAYLRAIQDPDAPAVAVDAWDLRDETGAVPASSGVELVEHRGYELYVASCASCHGAGAQGLDGLGLPLSSSGFIRGTSDKDLVTFIKMGRASWDENNTTGLDMPPKGGNPAITDEQLQLIVEYLRAVQRQSTGG